jgi:hypothetical protein
MVAQTVWHCCWMPAPTKRPGARCVSVSATWLFRQLVLMFLLSFSSLTASSMPFSSFVSSLPLHSWSVLCLSSATQMYCCVIWFYFQFVSQSQVISLPVMYVTACMCRISVRFSRVCGGWQVSDSQSQGLSALMIAAERGHAECVRLLLDAGAVKDSQQWVRIVKPLLFCLFCAALASFSMSRSTLYYPDLVLGSFFYLFHLNFLLFVRRA